MVMYAKSGNVLWKSNTNGNTGGYNLVMQNDDNLVLYSGGKARWSTKTSDSCEGKLNHCLSITNRL